MKKRNKYSPEFKIQCVKEVLEDHLSQWEVTRKYGLKTDTNIRKWIKNYLEYGEQYFYEEHRGNKRGTPYMALYTSKDLAHEKKLELENLKLRIENERLKKGYMVKGVGAEKEYVTTLDVNMKSSKN